jgi:hypothetical protein
MDLPEPLSSMLRSVYWGKYIKENVPIRVDSIQKSVPYLFVKREGVYKNIAIGIITEDRTDSFYLGSSKLDFDLCFTFNKLGIQGSSLKYNSSYPKYLAEYDIYNLPSEIYGEMMLANSFSWKLRKYVKYGDDIYVDLYKKHPQDDLNETIDNLIDLNKTDYLKIPVLHNDSTPLMILAGADKSLVLGNIMKKIINYYSVKEINHQSRYYYRKALSYANSPEKRKIIDDAIENNELTGFIAASNAYYNKKGEYNPMTAVDFHDMHKYMSNDKNNSSGGKKSKRNRKNKRKTRKHK